MGVRSVRVGRWVWWKRGAVISDSRGGDGRFWNFDSHPLERDAAAALSPPSVGVPKYPGSMSSVAHGTHQPSHARMKEGVSSEKEGAPRTQHFGDGCAIGEIAQA